MGYTLASFTKLHTSLPWHQNRWPWINELQRRMAVILRHSTEFSRFGSQLYVRILWRQETHQEMR